MSIFWTYEGHDVVFQVSVTMTMSKIMSCFYKSSAGSDVDDKSHHRHTCWLATENSNIGIFRGFKQKVQDIKGQILEFSPCSKTYYYSRTLSQYVVLSIIIIIKQKFTTFGLSEFYQQEQ